MFYIAALVYSVTMITPSNKSQLILSAMFSAVFISNEILVDLSCTMGMLKIKSGSSYDNGSILVMVIMEVVLAILKTVATISLTIKVGTFIETVLNCTALALIGKTDSALCTISGIRTIMVEWKDCTKRHVTIPTMKLPSILSIVTLFAIFITMILIRLLI
jgi:hypothetical protein